MISGGFSSFHTVGDIKNHNRGSKYIVTGEQTCGENDQKNPEEQEYLENVEEWDELRNLQDLESLLGDFNVGSMPSHLSSHESNQVSTFGFIPLSANHAVQGPVSNAAPSSLWGKRVPMESEKYFNFDTCRVPVKSGFKVEKFRAMAGDYWDKQLFDLITFGFPLDVGTQFHPSNHNINHASAINYPDEVNKYVSKEIGAGALHSINYDKFHFYHTSRLCRVLRRVIPGESYLTCHCPKRMGLP
jgi:hypothetical protein